MVVVESEDKVGLGGAAVWNFRQWSGCDGYPDPCKVGKQHHVRKNGENVLKCGNGIGMRAKKNFVLLVFAMSVVRVNGE
jgi:hypothetical protein